MASTRQRMIEAAAASMQRRGVAGTSFTEVLDHSGAARGAIYHHFPGGKTELAEAAVTWTGESVAGALSVLPAGDPATIVDAFLTLVRPVVAESTLGSGCAVAAGCTESAPDTPVQRAAGDALDGWRAALAERLVAGGDDREHAQRLAALLICTLEGAHVLCRAAASIDPFDAASSALRAARI